MMLFFVGVLEMMVAAAWTRAVSSSRVLPSGGITLVNIFIWYFVLQTVIEDITNWQVILYYAVGCAVGTMLTTEFFSRREKAKRRRRRQAKAVVSRPNVAYEASRTPLGEPR
jgi:glucose uptake protein GlcU